jgi:hypothetical protein
MASGVNRRWADLCHRRTGRWPTHLPGPVAEAPGDLRAVSWPPACSKTLSNRKVAPKGRGRPPADIVLPWAGYRVASGLAATANRSPSRRGGPPLRAARTVSCLAARSLPGYAARRLEPQGRRGMALDHRQPERLPGPLLELAAHLLDRLAVKYGRRRTSWTSLRAWRDFVRLRGAVASRASTAALKWAGSVGQAVTRRWRSGSERACASAGASAGAVSPEVLPDKWLRSAANWLLTGLFQVSRGAEGLGGTPG